MRHLHIDASNGLAGDMLLSALLDLGLPVATLLEALSALKIALPEITASRVTRGSLAATYLEIGEDESHPHHGHDPHHHGPARTLPDMLDILENSSLPEPVCKRAASVFRRLAEVEAAIHNQPVEGVHFHEVSGIDTIIDVIGVCALLDVWGVESVSASPVTVGTGSVECAHGRLPLPAPATAALLKGIPIRQEDTGCEMTTPTGAALVASLAQRFGAMPAMLVEAIGYGAGKRDLPGRSNTVRLFLGECHACQEGSERDTVVQLTCNLDDLTGEAAGYVIERLLGAGALDAVVAPIIMKKGRPGLQLTVLCGTKNRSIITDIIFTETSTFGLRVQNIEREILQREIIEVEVAGIPVEVKVGRRGGQV
ncbi:MAG: nickel pincer cofactor biosynthesis protein LarC, partial [Planctomycetes bacterium]|nr:nickel pincer cofactor biosynthesis protein LarC [Planctomycetota bacterium]